MKKKNNPYFNIPLTSPLIFWIGTMIANVFNWLFNLQAGRTLSKEELGVLTVFLAFQYLISVPANALSTTVSRFTAYYSEKGEQQKHFYFFRQYWWLSWAIGITAFVTFILIRGSLQSFFDIGSPILMVMFASLLIPLFLFAFERGTLSGQLAFPWIGMLLMIEAGTKFLFLTFVSPYLPIAPLTTAVLSLPISLTVAWIISLMVVRSYHPLPQEVTLPKDKKISETYKFLSFTLFATLGIVLIYNLDVLLVKHFFSATEAGTYSLLSLMGKMLYFAAGSLIGLLIPLTAKAQANNSTGRKPFLLLLGIVSAVGSIIFLMYLLIPNFIVSLLLTNQALVVLPYLPTYSLGMLFLVITTCFVTYNLAKENFLPAQLVIIGAAVQALLIMLFHNSLYQVTNIVALTLFSLLTLVVLVDVLNLTPNTLLNNIRSFLYLFSTHFPAESKVPGRTQILILNWRDIKHVRAGGAEVYIHEISKELIKSNYDVTIFTANDGHNRSTENTDGLNIIRRGGFITVYFWAAIYYLFKFRNKFDVILDSENGIPFFAPLYTSTPVILLVHHVHQDIFFKSLIPPFSWIAHFLETYFMPIIYQHSQVVAVSHSTATELLNEVGLAVTSIIPNGVDIKSYVGTEKASFPLISYVGRIKKYKSIEVLLYAFSKLQKEIPRAKVVIAGDGDHLTQLKKKVKELKLSKKVSFSGKVSEEEKIKLLGQSWVMVQPSYIEGWGITCLEANACQTPVLASRVSGLKEAVNEGKSGFLFEYGDHEDLYRKLKEMIINEKARECLNTSSRNWVKNFSWEKQSHKMNALIANIIGAEQLLVPNFSNLSSFLIKRVTNSRNRTINGIYKDGT